jgi:hypothetical protein
MKPMKPIVPLFTIVKEKFLFKLAGMIFILRMPIFLLSR